MKIKTIIIVLGMLLPILSIRAQDIKPLSIGDTVPDLVLHNVINYKDSVIRLSDFKDKLVILDFWATWCSPCVQQLNELSRNVANNADSLVIIAVSSEKKEKIHPFYKTHLKSSAPNCIYVADDRILNRILPHLSIPYEAWIRDGRLYALTNGEEVNSENIGRAFLKEDFAGHKRRDIQKFNKRLPVLSSLDDRSSEFLLWQSSIYKKLSGLSQTEVRQEYNGLEHVSFINETILSLYAHAFPIPYFNRRIVLDIADSGRFVFPSGYNPKWLEDNTYTYEQLYPKNTDPKVLQRKRVSDLDNWFGFKGRLENVESDCYCIYRDISFHKNLHKPIYQPSEYKDNSLRGEPISELIRQLNIQTQYDPTKRCFFDSTSLEGNIWLRLPKDPGLDIDELTKCLARQGIVLKKERKKFEHFVLSIQH